MLPSQPNHFSAAVKMQENEKGKKDFLAKPIYQSEVSFVVSLIAFDMNLCMLSF
jgi:hypothetical protein